MKARFAVGGVGRALLVLGLATFGMASSCADGGGARGAEVEAAGESPEADAGPGADVGPAAGGALEVGEPAEPTPEPNEPPAVADDLLVVPSGTTSALKVLYNDADPDGDMLRIIEVTQPVHGFVEILYEGAQIGYTCGQPEIGGLDSFTYTVSDGRGGEATATVDLQVQVTPTLVITSPTDGATITGTSVTVSFEVTGCTFTTPSANAFGCHGHKALDGYYWQAPGGGGTGHYDLGSFDIYPLTPGPHTIAFELTKNDGTDSPWEPSTIAFVDIQVQ